LHLADPFSVIPHSQPALEIAKSSGCVEMRTALGSFFACLGAWREETTIVHNFIAAHPNLVVDPIRHERKVVRKGLEMSNGNLDFLNRLVDDRRPHFLDNVGGHQVLQNIRLHRRHRLFRKDILQHIHQLFDSETRENFELVRHFGSFFGFKYRFFYFWLFLQFLQFFADLVTFLSLSPILRVYDRFSIVIANFTCLRPFFYRYRPFMSLSPILHRYDRFSIVIVVFLSLATRRYRQFCIVTSVFLSLSSILQR
jgi:hypothetical protein